MDFGKCLNTDCPIEYPSFVNSDVSAVESFCSLSSKYISFLMYQNVTPFFNIYQYNVQWIDERVHFGTTTTKRLIQRKT